MDKAPVTVVVLTKNEEKNIAECLASVHDWADEVLVIDDGSTDRTVEIARDYATRVLHRPMDSEGKHRNWAYAQAKNDWVLSIDADERVSPELREEISAALKDPQVEGFNVPLRNFIGRYWMRYGGMYPAAKLRLFRKDCFRYEEASVHPRVFFEGKVETLTKDILHYGYRDFAHLLSKLNNQTTLEARKWYTDRRKMSLGKAMWRTWDRFFRTYVVKKGFKDGLVGFMIAVFNALYQLVSYAKYWELKRDSEK